jgi:hypothetical protein
VAPVGPLAVVWPGRAKHFMYFSKLSGFHSSAMYELSDLSHRSLRERMEIQKSGNVRIVQKDELWVYIKLVILQMVDLKTT